MMEYIDQLEKNPAEVAKVTNSVWKSIVGSEKFVIQVAASIEDLKQSQGDLVAPWKKYFKTVMNPRDFR